MKRLPRKYTADSPRMVPCGRAPTIIRHLLKDKHWTRREIAEACFISKDSISLIQHRHRKHILATTMDALVELELTAEKRRVLNRGRSDATLVGRACQGLFAQGYTYRWIANSVGVHEDVIYKLANQTRGWVNRKTETNVLALVREVGSTPGPSNRARTMAARHGWLPTMYVDELV